MFLFKQVIWTYNKHENTKNYRKGCDGAARDRHGWVLRRDKMVADVWIGWAEEQAPEGHGEAQDVCLRGSMSCQVHHGKNFVRLKSPFFNFNLSNAVGVGKGGRHGCRF